MLSPPLSQQQYVQYSGISYFAFEITFPMPNADRYNIGIFKLATIDLYNICHMQRTPCSDDPTGSMIKCKSTQFRIQISTQLWPTRLDEAAHGKAIVGKEKHAHGKLVLVPL
jgi:hypothetical protein